MTDGQWPDLQVEVGNGFVEKLNFRPFDGRTGERTLPDGIQPGDRVAVRVWLEAKPYVDRKTGEPKLFVAKRADQVVCV
jgi:hypothetical protein